MPLFAITFEHHDLELRAAQLQPHARWLEEMVEQGFVVASGPLTDGPLASAAPVCALLVVRADSKGEALVRIATDPFYVHGVTDAMTITEWNPVFGAFAAESGGLDSLTG